MKYPKEIWADTDLVCSDEEHEGWERYVRADKSKPAWISVKDQLPKHRQRVMAIYKCVYHWRVVTFWKDAGGASHFGTPFESDNKGSQPATHWMPLPKMP